MLGDDGFGPAVIKQIEENYLLADNIGLLDAGTSVRDLLFDVILLGKKPKAIVIIDAVNHEKRAAGEIFEMALDQVPENKIVDYSLHQFPSTNMLKDLASYSQIDICFFAVQILTIPDCVEPGLSRPVKKAVTKMCHLILQHISDMGIPFCQTESAPC